MIISHTHKFIFVKTFKTAGSSIEKYLYDYLNQDDVITGEEKENVPTQNTKAVRHRTASWIKKWYPNEWNTYYKFSVDRNPWDMAVSWFHWMKYADRIQDTNFDSWLRQANYNNLKNWNRYTIDDEIVVDKVLQYELLHEQIQDIPVPYNNELLKIFLKSGHKPKEKNYRDFYTDETSKIIEDNFQEVIKLFGYKFK